jgi:AhpD family alkylhydroperoxidase
MEPIVRLVEEPRGMLQRYAWRFSKKKFGVVPDPVRAAAHHGGVLMAGGAMEMVVEKRWDRVDASLRWLVLQAVSAQIGCTWCIDYGYYEAMNSGIEPEKIRNVPRWRDCDLYTETERLVLEYAEAATTTPAVISDDLADRLRTTFDEAEIVELAGWIALENLRSRTNAALGLTSQGFSDKCEVVPLAV